MKGINAHKKCIFEYNIKSFWVFKTFDCKICERNVGITAQYRPIM